MSFYGQHEHRKLTIAGQQLALLDELCGPEQALRLRACAEALRADAASCSERMERAARARRRARARARPARVRARGDRRRRAGRARARRAAGARASACAALDALCAAAAAGAQALAPDDGETPGVAALLAAAERAAARRRAASTRAWTRSPSACARVAIESADLASELRAYGERPELGGESGAGADARRRRRAPGGASSA